MYKKRLITLVIGASLLLSLLSVTALATQYKGGKFDPNQIPNITSFVVVISTDDDEDELSLQPQSPLGPVGATTLLFKWNPLLLKNGKRPQVPYALTLLAFKPEEFKSFNGKLNLDPDTLKSHLVYFASGLSKTELQYPAKAPRLQPGLIYMWFIHTVYDDYLFTSDEAGVFCYGFNPWVKPGSRLQFLIGPRYPPVLRRQVDLQVNKYLQAEWKEQRHSVLITAVIENLGNSDASAFHVLFQAGGDSVSRSIGGLAAYATLTLTEEIYLSAPATGAVIVKVVADSLNEVTETNEANNSAECILY